MRKAQLLILCVLCAPLIAFAQINKPPEIGAYIHSKTAYGEGAYKALWIKAYDASLWTDASTWSMQSPFALSLHYSMHFTTDELVKRSIQEMQHIQPLVPAEASDYTAQLTRIFPDVHDGDVITALFIPRKEIRFYYNSKLTGVIKEMHFAKRFMDIWLSEHTSAPDLRKQLLSGLNK